MNQRLSKVRKNLYFFTETTLFNKKIECKYIFIVISIFCNSNELKTKIIAI